MITLSNVSFSSVSEEGDKLSQTKTTASVTLSAILVVDRRANPQVSREEVERELKILLWQAIYGDLSELAAQLEWVSMAKPSKERDVTAMQLFRKLHELLSYKEQ